MLRSAQHDSVRGAFCILAAVLASARAAPAAELRPVKPDAYAAFCMGIHETDEERPAEAVTWFEKALKLDPESAACHISIGILCDERLRAPAKATEHFKRALELVPDSFEARYGIARQLLRAGELAKGIEQMLIAAGTAEAKENPALPAKAYQELAVNLEQNGRTKEAVDYYTKAAAVSPNPVYPLVRLACLYRATGDHKNAVGAFLEVKRHVPTYAAVLLDLCGEYQALGQWKEALGEITAYMNHRSGPGETASLLKDAAELAEHAGLDQTARELHQKRLLKLVKTYPPDKATPALCEDIASALELLGQPEKAEPYLKKAIETADYTVKLRLRKKLVSLYQKLGQLDNAARQLRECIQAAEPKLSIAYRLELCAVLEHAQKYPEAETELRQIIDIPGAQAAGHAELGLFQERRGDHDAAARQLREAIKLADPAQSPRYRIHLALVHLSAGRPREAEQTLTEAKNMFPDDPSVKNALAGFYAERGQNLDEALALAQSALHADPRNPYFLGSLGWVYFKQGRTQEALEQLLKAASLASDGIICDRLGDAYMKLGQPDKAAVQWKRSLELDPQIKGVRDKLERLDKIR